MPLIKCPDCGKEVSDSTNRCIHCGARLVSKNKKRNLHSFFVILSIFGLLVFLFGVGYCFLGDTYYETNLRTHSPDYTAYFNYSLLEVVFGVGKKPTRIELYKYDNLLHRWVYEDASYAESIFGRNAITPDFFDVIIFLFLLSVIVLSFARIKFKKEHNYKVFAIMTGLISLFSIAIAFKCGFILGDDGYGIAIGCLFSVYSLVNLLYLAITRNSKFSI